MPWRCLVVMPPRRPASDLVSFFFAMVCLSGMGPLRRGGPLGGGPPRGGGPRGGPGWGSVEARVGCGDDGLPAFLVAALEGGFLDLLLVGEDPVLVLLGRLGAGEFQ